MGLPLSGVFDCLIPEFLKLDPFKFILLKDSRYFYYIKDILFIYL